MTNINSKTIGKFLNCFLCGTEYIEPRLLWCLHSYCESCLAEYIKDFRKATKELKGKTQEYNLTCPQCTTEVESTKTDGTKFTTGDFPRNFFSERLVQHKWRDGKDPGDKAEMDMEKSQVENAHSFTTKKVARNAGIFTCCQRSRDQTLNETDLYCVDCDVIVCNICQITDHTGHRCTTLQAVSTNFEKKVTNPTHQITSQIKHLRTKYETLKENQEQYHSNHQRIRSQIQQQAEILVELVKDHERFLLVKADEKHDSAMKHLDNQKQAMAAHISALSSALDFTSMLRKYGTNAEKVSLRKTVGKRLQELCDEDVQYKVDSVKTWTLRKPKATSERIGKIYGDLQEETTLNDTNQKSANLKLPAKDADNLPSIDRNSSKPKVPLQHLGKIYGDQQGETSLKDTDPKATIRELSTEDVINVRSIDCDSSKHDKLPMTNNREIPNNDTSDKPLLVCEPIWETKLPSEISQYCMRGMGINSIGNLVIGTSQSHRQAVYIVDSHCGKIMDRYIIDDGWTLHTITSTGKGILYLARGCRKFKIKVLECSDGIKSLQETQIECVGINTIAVDARNQLIIAANRYVEDSDLGGKAIKSDTNITIFDSETGAVRQRLTNHMYKSQNIDLLRQPEYLLSCGNGDILLADSGCQSVARLTPEGKLLFKRNVSKAPNLLSMDKGGNILVGYRHEKIITVLTKVGQSRSFLLAEVPKFFVIGKDKNLLVLDSLGSIRHFDYHQMLKD